MKKTAIIYDKWLSSLGGGEVVACNVALILKNIGYSVTLVSGKEILRKSIKEKLNLDLEGIHITTCWNDETKLRKITENADIFVNTSYMDYSYGNAKRNIYYVQFPTETYNTFKGLLFNNYILPFASKFIKPIEFISSHETQVYIDGHFAHEIKEHSKIAFSFLEDKYYILKFRILISKFNKNILEHIKVQIDGANIKSFSIKVDHHFNILKFKYKLKPKKDRIILNIKIDDVTENRLYLLYPKILPLGLPDFIYKTLYERINTRLRAGLFINLKNRLKSYDTFICHSEYVKGWIKKYWNIDAHVIYPPVDLLFNKYDINHIKKERIISSVGRFFKLGHGKKQEVMIRAFKKLFNIGYKDWSLHLVGGLGNEASSLEFYKHLLKEAKGYPIYFHVNVTKSEVENVLLRSKIYWHAAGFGEEEKQYPIRLEHFGIAPVEAISAGCIPILYKGGGLIEIINNLSLSDDYLFRNSAELIEKTAFFMNSQKKEFFQEDVNQKLINLFSKQQYRKFFLSIIYQD